MDNQCIDEKIYELPQTIAEKTVVFIAIVLPDKNTKKHDRTIVLSCYIIKELYLKRCSYIIIAISGVVISLSLEIPLDYISNSVNFKQY